MSNLNSSATPSENVSSTIHGLRFGYNAELSKITTTEFLECSKQVVAFIEKMGKMFAPLKMDMNGNITKINHTFQKNIVAHEYLENMVLAEQTAGGIITIDALQWLRRALHFIAKFFECIVIDTDNGSNQQNLVPFLKIAYEEVLHRYHGWMGGQLFNIMCRFAPKRKDLYKILASGSVYKEEDIIIDMRVFKTTLLFCVNHLIKFYHDNNLENEAPV